MAITTVNSIPANGSTGHYTDYNLFVEFDKQIEGSYLSSDFFKLYRANTDMTEFYEMVDIIVTISGNIVTINPTIILQSSSRYVLIVFGGEDGVRSIDSDTLDANLVVSFSTGTGVGPSSTGTDPSTTYNQSGSLVTNPSTSAFGNAPSSDVFSATGINTPIKFIGSVPEDRSVGILNIDRLILYYNDLVYSGEPIPPNSYQFKRSTVPVDPDPFTNNVISGELSIYNDQLIYDSNFDGSTVNTEFTFRIQPMVVRGQTRTGRDPKAHVIKFMGPLTPVYTTPEQITRRLIGYGIDRSDLNFEYDIWKAIHEVSLWVSEVYADLMGTSSLIAINRLTVCLVLREMLMRSSIFEGGIKLRQLLATKVEYMETDWGAISDELDRCIRESTPESRATILINVKSGRALMNSTRGYESKIYGVYR